MLSVQKAALVRRRRVTRQRVLRPKSTSADGSGTKVDVKVELPEALDKIKSPKFVLKATSVVVNPLEPPSGGTTLSVNISVSRA
jgi:hypothetical protein